MPALLPAVPRDRFDGGPIRYVLRDGRPVLYVTGGDGDGDDDGGRNDPRASQWRPFHEPDRCPDGDWVLWPPPPKDPDADVATQPWPAYVFGPDRR